MARDFARAFYNSKRWKQCRRSYISERQAVDGGLCELCGMEPGKIVHHKIWLTPENINDPDVSLNHENLRYECQTCHNKEPEGGDDSMNLYVFDADGQPVPLYPPENN